MTSLQITDADIPSFVGKIAIVSGGCSGIGLATVQLFAEKGACVFALDVNPPAEGAVLPTAATYVKCNQTSWDELNNAFAQAGGVDIAVANAGVSETEDFETDTWESETRLKEPKWGVIDVNYRGTVSFVKLATAWMRRQGRGGSIVITSSATAYAPEQSLPVYAGTKHGLIGFLRGQRSTLPQFGISINSVAPAATITALLPKHLATPLMAAGLPVSSPEFVARAVAFSASASQERSVEEYGKDQTGSGKGRWNGRTILTLGETYTELESGMAQAKADWFGADNLRLTRMQQTATDFRKF